MSATIDFKSSEQDSIFSPPEASDDLFDTPPTRLEIPPEPVYHAPSPLPTLAEESPALELAPSHTLEAPVEQFVVSEPGTLPSEGPPPELRGTENGLARLDGGPEDGLATLPRPVRRQQAAGSNWLLYMLVLPLVSYAILATVLMVIFYNKWRVTAANNDLLFRLPDLDGDKPGIRPGTEKPRGGGSTGGFCSIRCRRP